MVNEKDLFLENGWIVLPKIFSREHLSWLRHKSGEIVGNMSAGERSAVQSLGSIGRVENYPDLLEFAFDNSAMSSVEQKLGERLLYYVAVLFSKPLGSPATLWHQDFMAWDQQIAIERNASHLQIICYLDDVTEQSGCLRVVPRSHREEHELHRLWRKAIGAFGGDVRSFVLALRKKDDRFPWAYGRVQNEISIPCQAGDAILIDTRLLHGAFPNNLLVERRVLAMSYFSRFADFSSSFQAGIGHEIERQRSAYNNHVFSKFVDRVPALQKTKPNSFKSLFPLPGVLASA